MAAPLSTSCLQRWTLLQEAAQCSGVLQRRAGERAARHCPGWPGTSRGPTGFGLGLFNGLVSPHPVSQAARALLNGPGPRGA